MSRIDRVLSLIFKNNERRDRAFEWYIHNKNLYLKGNSEASFFKGLVNAQTYVVWWLGLRSVIPDFPIYAYILLVSGIVVCKVFVHWCIGKWWDRNNLFIRESDWSNKRNDVLNGLNVKILKKEVR